MEHFVPPIGWVLPFAGLLLAIALAPLVAHRLWESNAVKGALAAILATPVALLYLAKHPAVLSHAALDYLSFLILLASLFVISGGIHLEGDLEATPLNNVVLLGLGAMLASFIGTTGASMLLIRPLLASNAQRASVRHTVVFFIFLVSNVGGCLTPLGDPPLFLGYLAGVPFDWTLRLMPSWMLACAFVLVAYLFVDLVAYGREPRALKLRDRKERRPLRLRGAFNVALLIGVVASAAALPPPYRELSMLLLTAASAGLTPRQLREANRFTMAPIVEVAVLFAGIFVTMLPALDNLRAHGDALGVREPWQYFWATGLLSSFLDNAPTYLTFLAMAQGQELAAEVVGVPHRILEAISLGAVFMGANTYIGNGPNFMVRTIAEERGVRMPSFLGYMAWSVLVLGPLYLLLTLVVFLRPGA